MRVVSLGCAGTGSAAAVGMSTYIPACEKEAELAELMFACEALSLPPWLEPSVLCSEVASVQPA